MAEILVLDDTWKVQEGQCLLYVYQVECCIHWKRKEGSKEFDLFECQVCKKPFNTEIGVRKHIKSMYKYEKIIDCMTVILRVRDLKFSLKSFKIVTYITNKNI